ARLHRHRRRAAGADGLSLSGLRRKLEDAHRGEDVEIRFVLDRAARLYLISTSKGASHAIFDAPLKGTSTLFFKAQASILVALAGQFALLAGFISANLSSRQVVLGRRSVPISAILDIRGP